MSELVRKSLIINMAAPPKKYAIKAAGSALLKDEALVREYGICL